MFSDSDSSDEELSRIITDIDESPQDIQQSLHLRAGVSPEARVPPGGLTQEEWTIDYFSTYHTPLLNPGIPHELTQRCTDYTASILRRASAKMIQWDYVFYLLPRVWIMFPFIAREGLPHLTHLLTLTTSVLSATSLVFGWDLTVIELCNEMNIQGVYLPEVIEWLAQFSFLFTHVTLIVVSDGMMDLLLMFPMDIEEQPLAINIALHALQTSYTIMTPILFASPLLRIISCVLYACGHCPSARMLYAYTIMNRYTGESIAEMHTGFRCFRDQMIAYDMEFTNFLRDLTEEETPVLEITEPEPSPTE
uniref:OrfB n=1 Tax=Walleye dermal sarcoma virus TaxID=39720 RepID=A4GTG5_WDSV|nr:OrfB [Walleye dermal sarcoma virus]